MAYLKTPLKHDRISETKTSGLYSSVKQNARCDSAN